jgi:hypothetical protein
LLLINNKFPKILAEFEVYSDWQERLDRAQRCAYAAFRVALATTVMAATILGIRWLTSNENLFIIEAVWIFMFAIGGWCITRSTFRRLYRYLIIAVVATALLVLIGLITPPSAIEEGAWWRLLIPLAPILVLWGGVAWAILKDHQESPFSLLSLRWRPKVLFYGIGVGVLLFSQYFLAGIFSDSGAAPWPGETLNALGMIGRFGIVVLVWAVAEELIFRATIFDYLHHVRRINLWIAIFISMALNLLIYLPQTPTGASPGQQTLFWLGPAMLSITNALLWTWERGAHSAVVSNMTFRILYLLLR